VRDSANNKFNKLLTYHFRASGLAEIYWRGKFDHHCTAWSESSPDATRFGTSVQLTGRGTAAVARYWSADGKHAQVVTPLERIATATKALEGKRPGVRGRSRQPTWQPIWQ
jgi:hypothetical protein